MRRESKTELAIRRRLRLLVLLHKGSHSRDEIIATLDREHLLLYDHAVDPKTRARQQQYLFRHDLDALRLHFQIKHDHRNKRYWLVETPFGLALDQKHLAAFAMMYHTFTEKTFPHANDIQGLLAFVLSRLPDDQQKAVVEHRRALNIDFSERTDYSSLDPSTLTEVEWAILRNHQLVFVYRSPREGKEHRHVIEPKPLSFKNGHVYLHGWSVDYDKELHFRLDYILPGTAKMLHSPQRPRPAARSFLLRYCLTPILARNGVSQHFPDQQVEAHADGSVTVTAHITNLFEARQLVLKYGENCVVESPPELVEQMRVVAAHFAQTYLTPGG